jgi:hypothetical protein
VIPIIALLLVALVAIYGRRTPGPAAASATQLAAG